MKTAYGTVAEALREQIARGEFPTDRRLPTEAELSRTFGVSRQTVRHAFGELVSDGLVYRVPGRGSFVVASPGGEKYLRSLGSVDDLLALAVDTRMEVVEPFTRVVDVAAAGRLGLPSDEVAVGVFRRLHRGVPFSLTKTHLPPALAATIADDPRIATKGQRPTQLSLAYSRRAVPHPWRARTRASELRAQMPIWLSESAATPATRS